MTIAGSDTVFIPGERSLMYIVTPQLMTAPLITNWSYDHSTMKKISVFCLFVKLQYFSCNVFNKYLINLFIFYWRSSVLNILQQKDYLYKSSYQPDGGCIFNLISDFWPTTISTYDQAFRKYVVRKSESGCLMKNNGPVTDSWELRVLLFLCLRKNFTITWFHYIFFLSVRKDINTLNAELNLICHLLALLGGATIVVVSRLMVNRHKPA